MTPEYKMQILRDALLLAKEAIIWWEAEHACCAGASDEAIEKIEAALEITKESGK